MTSVAVLPNYHLPTMESGRQCQPRPNQVLGGKQPPVLLGTAASPRLPNMKRLGGHLEVEVARGSRRKKANAPKDEGRIAREWGMLMRCNAAEATRKPSTIPSSSLRRPIEAFRQLVGPPVPRVPRTNCIFRLPIFMLLPMLGCQKQLGQLPPPFVMPMHTQTWAAHEVHVEA